MEGGVIAIWERDTWETNRTKALHGVGPWKHINNLKDEFFQVMSFRIGNGNNVKVFND
ncbi:hypothetical protein HAX54_050928, partial [Datura stramonium]|nr:hypothetical protein [Datura stramonium]